MFGSFWCLVQDSIERHGNLAKHIYHHLSFIFPSYRPTSCWTILTADSDPSPRQSWRELEKSIQKALFFKWNLKGRFRFLGSSACISHYTLLHWICIAAAAVPPWFFLKFFPPRSPELFRNFWGVLPQNHLTCLGALLLSESGFCRASLLFLSSSDLPTQGLTCLGALLLSESAANSLFFCRCPLDFFSIAS